MSETKDYARLFGRAIAVIQITLTTLRGRTPGVGPTAEERLAEALIYASNRLADMEQEAKT